MYLDDSILCTYTVYMYMYIMHNYYALDIFMYKCLYTCIINTYIVVQTCMCAKWLMYFSINSLAIYLDVGLILLSRATFGKTSTGDTLVLILNVNGLHINMNVHAYIILYIR